MRHAIQYCAQAGTDPSVTDPVPIIVLSEQVYHRTVRPGEELCVKPKKIKDPVSGRVAKSEV